MPTFGPSSQDSDNRGASTSRLINCYRQPVMGEGRTRAVLKSVLGTTAFAAIGSVFFNGAYTFGGDMYAAYDGAMFRVSAMGTVTNIGTIASGDASISSNNQYLTIAAGGAYFTYLGTIQSQDTGALSSVGSIDYLDQYTVLTEKNGRRWAWSALADPTDIPVLNFATAEATDDNLLRVVTLNGRVVLFKETGREVWTNTGLAGAEAFTRIDAKNVGLKSFNLVTKTDEALFFIGNDNIARMTLDGLEARKFSYPPVDTAISQNNATHCFYYEDEGQKFCVIRFSDRTSWVLDLATAEWHERAEGADHDPWSVLGVVKRQNDWYGFRGDGQVLRFTRNNADALTVGGGFGLGFGPGFAKPSPLDALRRTAVSQTFYFPEGASVDELEIFFRTGFSDLRRDAQTWLRVSRDGGHTWTPGKWRSLGAAGEYRQKATWRALGNANQFTIEINISEPDEIPVWSDFMMEAA